MRSRATPRSRLLVALLLVSAAGLTHAQDSTAPAAVKEADPAAPAAAKPVLEAANVVVDGRVLFQVVGTLAYPARKRAQEIANRITTLAADPEVSIDGLELKEHEISDGITAPQIAAGKTMIAVVLDADARLAGLEREVLATAILERIKEAMRAYREERTTARLRNRTIYTLLATVVLALIIVGAVLARRRLAAYIEKRARFAAADTQRETIGTVAAEHFWQFAHPALEGLFALLLLTAAYAYVNYALYSFPWTRHAAEWLLGLIVTPLLSMGQAFVESIPDLMYIAILAMVVRYLLQLLSVLFLSVERGSIRWPGFEREWAMPTFKLVRIGVIVFAVVIAYPYIPGSSSEAFKGMSVFLGVLFSIGASSMVSNSLAGYVLLYRKAFRIGDRVTIGQHTGDIVQTRQQVTVLRTPKNEDVLIPNSEILNASIINYSSMARRKELLLHTSVTIGYDTPWRHVEAMLLTAASRTQGLLQKPPPFVLKTALEDFYVRYEINVYCDDASRMAGHYSQLHQNILDVFNESGVQIMSPHFMAQPDEAVVAPLHTAQALPDSSRAGESPERSE